MSHLHHRVSALVDGELQGRARDRALAHADNCRMCREEIAATIALKQRLLGLPVAEPAANLFSSIGPVVPQGRLREAPVRARAVPRRLLMGAGSVSLAVLSVAYAVGAPHEPVSTLVSPPLEDYTAQFARDSSRTALADSAVSMFTPSGQTDADPHLSATATAAVGESLATDYAPNQSTQWARTSAADDPQAVALLQSAVAAPLTSAYRGTRAIWVADDGEPVTTQVEVNHAPGQGTSFHPSGLSDSSASFVEAGGAALDRFSTDSLEHLLDTFEVSVGGSTRLLGRATVVIEAHREGRLAARFWVDEASGLLLRRDLYDVGRLMRSSRFTSLQVTRSAFLSHLPPEVSAPAATALPIQVSSVLQDEGWTCPQTLPGGGSLISLRRLEGVEEGVQATYTDGLVTTSVFEQRGGLDPQSANVLAQTFDRTRLGGSTVYLRSGLPTVAVWQSGQVTYTVITDAVPSAAEDVLSALPHEPVASEGNGNRLRTGLGRIWALLDPTSQPD